MDKLLLALGLFLLCFSGGILFRNYRRTKRTMDRLDAMLRAAMEDDFQETVFDESRLSALETRFAHYLSSSAVSARNVKEEKDRIKELISDLSHQTKTPIANLLLYSELLEEQELPEEAKENVKAIHIQVEKLRFLIDSLVKLSRLESGILTLHPKLQSVADMLENVCEQYMPKAEKKGLVLSCNVTDISACFDEKWTSEALANILDNAVKYTEKGEIRVSAKEYELFVRIDIEDTGIGIEEGEQAEIFSRFYRSQRVRENEGVGIGLFLARQIIAGQGGYIKVRSEIGVGSVFSVFLPKM